HALAIIRARRTMSTLASPLAPTAPATESAPRAVRFPIAIKLMLMTAALVLALMAGFVGISLLELQQQYRTSAERLQQAEMTALRDRALANVRNLASGITGALFEGDVALV